MKRQKNDFPDEYYSTAVSVSSKEEALEVVKKWAKYKKTSIERQNIYLLSDIDFKINKMILYLAKNNIYNADWSYDKGSYAREMNYTPLTYKEFLETYFYTPSKYVKQLKFESFKDMIIETSQVPLPLYQDWYKKEYDKEYRFNRIICRKCGKENIDDNKITKKVKCPDCDFRGGIVQ